MNWWLTILVVALASVPGRAALVEELPLGQAIWRPGAGTMEVARPDGGTAPVTADLWGIALDRPTRVVIRLQTVSTLGLVIRALDPPTEQPLGVLAAGQPFAKELAAGRYLLTVAGNQGGGNGPYLLSAALPPAASGGFTGGLAEVKPGAGVALLGRYQLGVAAGLAIGPGGQWVATWQGEQAWLHQIESGETFGVPTMGGAVRRLAFTSDGWALMAVTEQGALMLAMPDLAPFARFTAQTGVLDAVPAPEHRVVVLPRDAPAYVSSPVEGDLAYLPGTKGAVRLIGGQSALVGLWYADRQVQVFDSLERRELGRIRWPHEPTGLALHPVEPTVAGAGPETTALWRVGSSTSAALFGGAGAVAYHAAGQLALATPEGVLIATAEDQATPLEPAVQAIALDFNAAGHRLGALTAAGEVLLWDTISLLKHEAGEATGDLLAARAAYNEGLTAMKAMDFASARQQFVQCRDLMAALPATGEVAEFRVLALLRLSQASYLVKDYAASLAEADEYLAAARQLPDGKFKSYNVPQAIYRRADALWELDRQAEARRDYQQALDAGLEGLAADDARQKVAE
jgi:hypothetical protein